MDWLVDVLARIEWAILAYFVLVNGWYAVLLGTAVRELRRRMIEIGAGDHSRLQGAVTAPEITVLAPAYNEASTIGESVRALLALQYPNLEVVVVDDGSSDQTMEVLRDRFDLVPIAPVHERRIATAEVRGLFRSRSDPRLLVATKANGGKGDTLNAALNLASGELVCSIDADTLIEPDALRRMVRPFLRDRRTVAAGGTIRIANGSSVHNGRVVKGAAPRRPLPGFQAIEYLRAFLFGRLGWNRLGGNLIVSGAFGLFRRDALMATGGYATDSIGEDLELVIRLRRAGYDSGGASRVEFLPDPVAWTEGPETVRTLARQRERWHHGLADSLVRHRDLFLNPRYGAMGMVVYPYFLLVELLAPLVEVVGLIGIALGILLGAFDWGFALLFLLLAYGTGAVLTVATLTAEELGFRRYRSLRDLLVLLGWALTENFGYRQLTVFWRVRGLWRYLRGHAHWGDMQRQGFSGSTERDAAPAKPHREPASAAARSVGAGILLAAAATGAAATGVHAQAPSRIEVEHHREWLSERQDWTETTVRAGRSAPGTFSWTAAVSRWSRFGQVDTGGEARVWIPARDGTTVTFGAAATSSAEFQQRWAVSAGAQQDLGAGWVAGLRAMRRAYPDATVDLATGQLGRYFPLLMTAAEAERSARRDRRD